MNMYISDIKIENFRNFKSKTIEFKEGVNVIIGHNNAGKSNLLKALALVLNNDASRRLDIDDFNKNISFEDLRDTPPKVVITVTIKKGNDETPDDLVTVGNWLIKLDASYEAKLTYEFYLPEKEKENYITELSRITESNPTLAKDKAWKTIKHNFIRLYTYKIWGGDIKTKTVADSESLQKFDFQFLDAIRDVERDMLTGKNTLLRDVFQFFLDYDLKEDMNSLAEDIQNIRKEEIRTRQEEFSNLADSTLKQLQRRMEKGKEEILSYAKETGASFNNAIPDFEGSLSEIEMFSALKLIIKYETGIDIKIPATHNGLGYNNLIFMSLLLAKMQVDCDGSYMGSNAKVFSTLAIEEPEAHLHPSMQYKFLKFLKDSKNKARQIFVTTHSTHITSAVSLDEIICLHNENGETSVGYTGRVFPSDNKSKKYVQRFLDATKSDMLFAQKVILVEGLAEQLLMSLFAKYYDIKSQEEFTSAQLANPTGEIYLSKTLEDNHIAVINVGGRHFDHFLHLFDQNNSNTINKKIVCLTDRDLERKLKTEKKYKKCYPFDYQQDASVYDYQDNPSNNIGKYSSHPNIRFFSQDVNKGKTFEYDLVLHNPSLKLLVTESMSNRDEIIKLMTYMGDPTKSVADFLSLLPKGTDTNPNAKNRAIEGGINSCNWTSDDDKKKAIIASRYLNSVGKGENALELAYALEENLEKKGTDEYNEFVVPQYIKDAIDWICR
ncbi:ATP-dependent endonuclease [Marinifilum breve]|uniref:ATP-dependent endonuclease n=2 Tax=Marinifilum breve TaxID=2184082 RepID=A0A2V3ZUA1_9BACT|nr:ATP-dependent endonuclease [Marinifilum breve]